MSDISFFLTCGEWEEERTVENTFSSEKIGVYIETGAKTLLWDWGFSSSQCYI